MTKDEILTWLAVKRGGVCVDRSPLAEWGKIRQVTIRSPARVEVQFLSSDTDDGGPTYVADAGTVDAAIEAVADYLGRSDQEWENFSQTGRFPEPPSSASPQATFVAAVRDHALPLPRGLNFRISEKYWRDVARAHLDPREHEVVGRWEQVGDANRGDAACDRIKHLVANVLEKLGARRAAGGWETLYRDPADGRLGERTFPLSHLDGGPPKLATISEEEAIEKYGRAARGQNSKR